MKSPRTRPVSKRARKALDAALREAFGKVEQAGAPAHLVELADRLEAEKSAAPEADDD